jgi:hypothetical protein
LKGILNEIGDCPGFPDFATLSAYWKGAVAMSYTKKDFGQRLRNRLSAGYDVVKIARWAHREFLENIGELDPRLDAEVMKVIAMEEGPEFEMTEGELQDMARRLESSSDFGEI